MDSPRLNRRVTLLKPAAPEPDTPEAATPVRNDWNTPVVVGHDEIKVWADRRDISVSETVGVRLNLSNTRSLYTIRYRTDIDSNWRLKDDSTYFGIKGIRETERRRYLILECESRKI